MHKTFLFSLFAILVLAPTGLAQEFELQNEISDSENAKEFKYLGVKECAGCHNIPSAVDRSEKVTDFVLMNEYSTWLNDDPHARAWLSIVPDQKLLESVKGELNDFMQLANKEAGRESVNNPNLEPSSWEESTNKRSAEILSRISGATQSEIRDVFLTMTSPAIPGVHNNDLQKHPPKLVSTLKQCMTCHAGLDIDNDIFDFQFSKYGTGVSCEGCHGPSSAWLNEHRDEKKWRTMAPNDKLKKFGLYNTRQPISKSKLCFSCHIGDLKQGKVVTHEMYAAGHPPLPSIEIESFSDQLPRHWRYLTEKKEFNFANEFKELIGKDLATKNQSSQANEYPQTTNLLVGGAVAAAQSIDLLTDMASEYVDLQTKIGRLDVDRNSTWPEFAAFDCAACHHDLKAGGQQRGFAGVPGRPAAHYWPRTLSKLGVAFLSVQQQGDFIQRYEMIQNEFQNSLDAQPFGVPEDLRVAGKHYSDFLINVAREIQSAPLTREDSLVVLQILCGSHESRFFRPEHETWDFHSARQLGWAIKVVNSELSQPKQFGKQCLSSQFISPISEVAAALDEIQTYLMLELAPPGRITTQQQKFLETWQNFDRKRFIELVAQFSTAINKSDIARNDNRRQTQYPIGSAGL